MLQNVHVVPECVKCYTSSLSVMHHNGKRDFSQINRFVKSFIQQFKFSIVSQISNLKSIFWLVEIRTRNSTVSNSKRINDYTSFFGRDNFLSIKFGAIGRIFKHQTSVLTKDTVFIFFHAYLCAVSTTHNLFLHNHNLNLHLITNSTLN